jgi:glycosyltransferase involved in cell wall biosynthesis
MAPYAPDFDRQSGSLRFFSILRILSQRYRVVFVRDAAPAGTAEDRYVESLKALGIDVHWGDRSSVRKILRQQHAGVIFEFFHCAERWIHMVRGLCPDLPVAVDSVDLHFMRETRAAEYSTDRASALEEARRTRKRELTVYRAADIVITVTDQDREALLAHEPGARATVIPNIHAMAGTVPAFRSRCRHSLLFVGGFNHLPNVDAVLFLTQEVMPRVRRRLPDVTLTVVGDSAPSEVRRMVAEDVVLTGWVPEIGPYLDSHALSVAPLRFGAGMKGKVGEAMAAGLPVVATKVAAEGMGLKHGVDVVIADSADDFAAAVVKVCTDEDLHVRLSENGRRTARERWSEGTVAARVWDAMDRLESIRPKRLHPLRRGLVRTRELCAATGVPAKVQRLRVELRRRLHI